MSLELYTGPGVEVISLQEAKDHLRAIEESEGLQDALIEDAIASARRYVDGRDGVLGRQLVTATWDLTLDAFPCADFIRLPLPPIQSITSVTYTDTDGVSQTFSGANYKLSADRNWRPRLDLAYGATWPSTRCERDAVTVRFIAGYGEPADVPAPIRRAMLLLIGHWFNNAEASVIGTIVADLPMGVDALLDLYRVRDFS